MSSLPNWMILPELSPFPCHDTSATMALVKSSISIVGIVAGSLGAVICVTAIIVLWIVSARLDRATGRLFSKMDHSLVLVRDRLSQSQERVAAAKITAQDVETALRDWTKQQTTRRIESRIQAAEKTEHLASALRQVDTWLEISESSVEIMSEVLAIAKSPSTPDETTLLEQFIAEISSLRTLCAEATQIADRVHERVAQASDENSLQERVAQAVQLVLRAVATLSSIDSRLEKSAERLSVAQRQLQELQSQTRRWIVAATIVITLLVCWMAAGQIALCRLAWDGWRQI
jgi:hypothetical protein